MEIKKIKETYWGAFRSSFRLFKNHDTLTLGAALSYYMGFSLVPILIIAMSVAGAIFGPMAVQGEVQRQLAHLLGAGPSEQLQEIIKAAYKPGEHTLAATLALIALLVGATTVFGQLRTSLNTIWEVKEQAKKPVMRFLINRLFSFAMIGCLIFLLLISLTIHTGLEALAHFLSKRNPEISADLLNVIDLIFSFVLTGILFSFVYKYMSDAKLKWKSIFPGAFFTAILFALGKYLIGFYLSKADIASTYGAASSIVLILLWVFYSSQILFFGAEFTRALSVEKGVSLDPVAIKKIPEPEVRIHR